MLEEGPVVDLHRVAEIRPPCTLTFFNSRGDHGLNFLCPLFSIPGIEPFIIRVNPLLTSHRKLFNPLQHSRLHHRGAAPRCDACLGLGGGAAFDRGGLQAIGSRQQAASS